MSLHTWVVFAFFFSVKVHKIMIMRNMSILNILEHKLCSDTGKLVACTAGVPIRGEQKAVPGEREEEEEGRERLPARSVILINAPN